MASLNSNGDIKIPKGEQETLHFLLLNADCHLVTKKTLTDIDKKAVGLSSDLLNLICKRRGQEWHR